MATVWTNENKAGIGWQYDQIPLAYDGPTNPETGDAMYYDALGTSIVWTTVTKH